MCSLLFLCLAETDANDRTSPRSCSFQLSKPILLFDPVCIASGLAPSAVGAFFLKSDVLVSPSIRGLPSAASLLAFKVWSPSPLFPQTRPLRRPMASVLRSTLEHCVEKKSLTLRLCNTFHLINIHRRERPFKLTFTSTKLDGGTH